MSQHNEQIINQARSLILVLMLIQNSEILYQNYP